MEEFYKKLGLLKMTHIELNTSKETFKQKLKENIEESDLGLFSSSFEAFSSSKHMFKGKLGFDTFELKKRRTFFNSQFTMAKAKGKYWSKNEKLIIELTINAVHPFFIVFILFGLLFYIIFIGSFMFSGSNEGLFAIPFLLIHASFMIGIPYFMMRKSIKALERDLEREFVYILNK